MYIVYFYSDIYGKGYMYVITKHLIVLYIMTQD